MTSESKIKLYEATYLETKSLFETAMSRTAQMATLVALLHTKFDEFDWTGFYCKNESGVLEIGPYQGHLACLLIPMGKGVCGEAAQKKQTMVVPDVTQIDNYIACDSATLSEIVVPIIRNKEVIAVLDIDSNQKAVFDEVDQAHLEKIVELIS